MSKDLMRVPDEFKKKIEDGVTYLKEKSPNAVKEDITNQTVLRTITPKIDIRRLLGDEPDIKRFFGGKRGITDLIFIFISIFIAGMTLIVSAILWNSFKTAYITLGMNTTAVSNTVLTNVSGIFAPMDYYVMALLIGLYIGMLYSAFQIDVHPIFVIFFIVASVLVEFISAIISNTWSMIVSDPTLVAYAVTFPKTNLVFTNLPYISLGLIVGGIVVIYSKLVRTQTV